MGTSNELIMKLEYYSSFGAAFGGPEYLGEVPLVIADGTSTEDTWVPHQIVDVAPAGAVEARISFVFRQPGIDGGAVHIDGVSLLATDPILNGDFDGDGEVDGADFFNWQTGEVSSPPSSSDLAVWKATYGSSVLLAARSIPEPSSWVVALVGFYTLLGLRRSAPRSFTVQRCRGMP